MSAASEITPSSTIPDLEAPLARQEKARIAREIHDGPLSVLGYLLTSGRLDQLSAEMVASVSNELRLIIDELYLPVIDLGLLPALEWLIERERSFGVQIDLAFAGNAQARLPQLVEWTIFRIAQQALTNTHDHAQHAPVHVKLRMNANQLRLEVRDEGPGFEPLREQQAFAEGRRGLSSMHVRAESIGAKLLIDGRHGAKVKLEWHA